MISPAVRMGFPYSWKQLFTAGSTTKVKQKSFKQKSLCWASTLAWLSDCFSNGMGVTANISMHDKIGFTIFMWQCSEIWLGTANFLTAEVTVWTNVKVARPFLLRPGNKARKMYNDCDHTVTIAVMFWLKGIVIVLELTLMLKLWVLLSPCWPPSLASTVVSIMWCHVMCALMGANYEVVAYEQPGREASCELVDAVRVYCKVS